MLSAVFILLQPYKFQEDFTKIIGWFYNRRISISGFTGKKEGEWDVNMRKPILSLVGLLAVVSLVGCQQVEGKGNSKELSQEQIIDKGLEAFEHLKMEQSIWKMKRERL